MTILLVILASGILLGLLPGRVATRALFTLAASVFCGVYLFDSSPSETVATLLYGGFLALPVLAVGLVLGKVARPSFGASLR